MKRHIAIALMVLLACSNAYASCELRADTTNNNFAIGPFVDPTTGDAEDGLTVADGDILWKQPDSTTFAEETGFSDCTHRAAGMYTCPYDETVVDVEGMAQYVVDVAGALTVFGNCMVVKASYYDLKYDATTDLLTSRCAGSLYCGDDDAGDIASVTSQVIFVLGGGASNNDAYNDAIVCVVGGTEEGCGQVSDWDGGTLTITLDSALAFTVAADDDIYIYPPSMRDTVNAIFADTDELVTDDTPAALTAIDGKIDTAQGSLDNLEGAVILASGSCDSGTTTTCVDDALTQANDIFKGAAIVFPSLGETSCVYDFVAASDTLTFWAVQTDIDTEAYHLVVSPLCELAQDETP